MHPNKCISSCLCVTEVGVFVLFVRVHSSLSYFPLMSVYF
jgi:hypothetical protein